jgi:hypothetical protein
LIVLFSSLSVAVRTTTADYSVYFTLITGEVISISNVLLGRMGLRDIGGPTQTAAEEGQRMRNEVRRLSYTD